MQALSDAPFFLKPGAQVAHRWYALSLATMGRHDEAIAEMERAREISPRIVVDSPDEMKALQVVRIPAEVTKVLHQHNRPIELGVVQVRMFCYLSICARIFAPVERSATN